MAQRELAREATKRSHDLKLGISKPKPEGARQLNLEEQKQFNEDLLQAACTGSNSRIERLLEAGADIWARDNSGKTAFMLAAANGCTETCMFLIEKLVEQGGDAREYIEAENYHNWAAIRTARFTDKNETAAFIEAMLSLLDLMENKNFGAFLSSLRGCVAQ
jgi:ankyrin repeat protein